MDHLHPPAAELGRDPNDLAERVRAGERIARIAQARVEDRDAQRAHLVEQIEGVAAIRGEATEQGLEPCPVQAP